MLYHAKRLCVTGAIEYRYYQEEKLIGSAVTLVVPGYPVFIRCSNLQLHCQRDPDATIVPGSYVSLHCENSRQEYARLVWQGPGRSCLRIGSETIVIIHRDGICHFFRNRTLLAVLHPISGPSADEWELRMEFTALLPLPDPLLTLLMSFPLLQIGW